MYVGVYMHVCVCVSVCIWMHVCHGVYEEVRGHPQVSVINLLPR